MRVILDAGQAVFLRGLRPGVVRLDAVVTIEVVPVTAEYTAGVIGLLADSLAGGWGYETAQALNVRFTLEAGIVLLSERRTWPSSILS